MTDYVEKIATQEGTKTIGGYQLDGQLMSAGTAAIFSGITWTQNQQRSYSLSSWIPNDGYTYEVTFTGRIFTPATAGFNVGLTIRPATNNTASYLCRVIAPTAHQYCAAGNCTVVIAGTEERSIRVTNEYSSSGTTGSSWLYLKTYRRIGRLS